MIGIRVSVDKGYSNGRMEASSPNKATIVNVPKKSV